ncbi:MAG: hypothetical protein H6Q58_2344 [Firmicutes bacterium]|nr:hypothetical protein [Bacillota bacterium]
MKEKGKAKKISEMIEELEQYYVTAGFSTSDYERNLKGKTPEEIQALYRDAFEDDPGNFFDEEP